MKEFDNIRYRRMRKVLLGHDEQISINTSNSSVPNCSNLESNEMILMEMNHSNNTSYPLLDDDDSQSADFISNSNPIYLADDDASLNSSQSSLQHPSSTPLHSLLIDRQTSSSSQPAQSQIISDSTNVNRRFSSMDINPINPMSPLHTLPPLQIHIDEGHMPIRTDVRLSGECFRKFFF